MNQIKQDTGNHFYLLMIVFVSALGGVLGGLIAGKLYRLPDLSE